MNEKNLIVGKPSSNENEHKRGIGEFIFNVCCKYGDQPFQISVETDEQETFTSFKKRSTRLAIRLKELAVTNNDIIAVYSHNTMDNLVPIVASLFLGAKVTSFEPSSSKDELKYLINVVKPKLIFVQQKCLNTIHETLSHEELSSVIVIEDFLSKHTVPNEENEETFKPAIVDCYETAFIFFSSGSTGLPKGISISHYSLLYGSDNILQGNTKQIGILCLDTTYWSITILMMLIIFKTGAYRVVTQGGYPENAEVLLKIIDKHMVTLVFLAATWTSLLLRANVKKFDLKYFKKMIIAGSKLSSEHLTNIRLQFPNTFISFIYGQTEIQVFSQFHMIQDRELYLRKPESVGKVTNGVVAKIVDLQTNEALGPNKKGELRVKTACLMNGYYKTNESTFDEFGFHKTGDIAYYDDDHCFYIVGRINDTFKFKGYIILPYFIEQCLMKHKAVKEAVVFGIPLKKFGEIPTALVTIQKDCEVTEEELIKFANAQVVVESYKLAGGLKIVDALPKTCTNKIIRFKSREMYLKLLNDTNFNGDSKLINF